MSKNIQPHDKHIIGLKVYWSLVTLVLFSGMTYGSFYLMGNLSVIKYNLIGELDFLRYKLEFSIFSDDGITRFFGFKSHENETNSNAKSIPILLYHGIIQEPDGHNVLLEDFKEHMFALKRAGYQTVTLDDFNGFIKGEKELPDKSFLLTFDDGRKDSYYPTDPILKALDYNAVMFVITERSGESAFYLSEKELGQMIDSKRWELQSHGKFAHDFFIIDDQGNQGHFLTNKLWIEDEERLETDDEFKDRIMEDLISSKNDLESGFDVNVMGFAFPYGDFGQRASNFDNSQDILLTAVQSIYEFAFYQYSSYFEEPFNYPNEDTFMIKRITIDPEWSGENLLNFLESNNH